MKSVGILCAKYTSLHEHMAFLEEEVRYMYTISIIKRPFNPFNIHYDLIFSPYSSSPLLAEYILFLNQDFFYLVTFIYNYYFC